MYIFPLVNRSENHPIYQSLAAANLARQYTFLDSIIEAATRLDHVSVSHHLIKSLNFHVIACLHQHAGEYRPRPVRIPGGHIPPPPEAVKGLMHQLIVDLNKNWNSNYLVLAAYAFWKLNWIHPFVNGNGRTARALCHYIVCRKNGGFPQMGPLPELILRSRDQSIQALRRTDEAGDLKHVVDFLINISTAATYIPE